jgi:hypothetical protein
MVARDIHTSNGGLLIAAGQNLTPRVVSMLDDLHALERLDGAIWIAT